MPPWSGLVYGRQEVPPLQGSAQQRPEPYFRGMVHAPVLVGIAGGSGSGKTSLIRAVRESLPPGSVSVVSQDDYYHPQEKQQKDINGWVNYDLPSAVDLEAFSDDLSQLKAGKAIRRREYTFNNMAREAGWVETHPAALVLVEGLFVLHHGPMRERFDLRVFVNAEEETQLQRRLRRDKVERGYGAESVLYQWENHVLPAYRSYLLPYRGHCEVLVDNDRTFTEAVDHLRERLASLIGLGAAVQTL